MRGKLRRSCSARLSHIVVLAVAGAMLLTSAVNSPSQALSVATAAPTELAISQPILSAVPRLAVNHTAAATPHRDHAPKLTPTTEQPATLLPPRTDCTSQPCVVLSFDDGPNPLTTPAVLTILEQKHVPASFFLVGSNIAGNQTLVQRMAADGFEIGNHSWSHTDMTKLTPPQIASELTSTQDAIAAAGAPRPTLFRPPYGAINEQLVAQAGLQTALWNIDPEDWRATDPAALAQAIVATAKPGGIFDLHDIHQVTVDALPSVIDQLQAAGYKFVTVSQLLHSRDRPGGEPFYGYAQPAPPM